VSITADITDDHEWFVGEDKTIAFHVKDASGVPVNIATWDMEWALKANPDSVALLSKETGGDGITVTGAYNVDPVTNTQRAVVTIDDGDTEDIDPGEYIHALKKTNDPKSVLADGTVTLKQAAL